MLAFTTRSLLPPRNQSNQHSSPSTHLYSKKPSPSTSICLRNDLISFNNLFQTQKYASKTRAKRLPLGGFNNAGGFFVGPSILRQLEDHRALNAPTLNKKLFLLLEEGDKIILSYYNDNGGFYKFKGYVRERTSVGFRSTFVVQSLAMGIEMKFHFFSPLLHSALVMKPTSDFVPKDLGRNFRMRKVVIDEVNQYISKITGKPAPPVIPLKVVPKANYLRAQQQYAKAHQPHGIHLQPQVKGTTHNDQQTSSSPNRSRKPLH